MANLHDYTLVIFILFVSTIVVKVVFSKTRNTKGGLPPSPVALPILGHLHLLGPIPHQALYKLSSKYGPLMHLNFGSVSCVIASSAEIAKEFLKTHELSFLDRPNSVAMNIITYGSADFSFAPYGPYWKFMKKLCMSELLGGRTLEQLFPVRQEEIQRFLQSMFCKSKTGESVNLNEELIKVANNVISRMTMSRRCSDTDNEANEVRELIHEIAELTGKFNLSDYISFCKNLDLQGFKKRLEDVHKRFDDMTEKIMKEHEDIRRKTKETGSGGDGVKDLLHILLDISEDVNAEMKLTRENIKAFILDIFVAGTDTSAITTEWAIAELINHPEIFKKAREEIDFAVGKTRLVAESDITNLPYLQAIVKETLRLHPTGPLILRESTEDCKIAGYNIPANTRLFVNVWAIGRDPKHWENPLEFRPERFVMNEDEKSGKSQIDVRGQHFHLLPFGSGRRGCPGTSLALQVVQTTLASMIQCFDWKVDGNGEVDMTEGAGLTLPRAHPLVCIPVARLTPFTSS
ncbi:hypothetical protein GIB67_040180 [Kingdonia uniflora]|uniref:Flavone synthase II n=1 Tax=Kingdonia uniflora TaxID=39325 RepID=A0A7J7MUW2_9MAGN|nr:hypothetical protein GIB67_040180 [Kingdonia uniflora]